MIAASSRLDDAFSQRHFSISISLLFMRLRR